MTRQHLPLLQLIYASAEAEPFCDEQLGALLRSSRERNGSRGITGMLLYHDGSFIQVLEGRPAQVIGLYQRIARDPRHSGVTVLFRQLVDERSFGEWRMGYAQVEASDMAEVPGLVDFFSQQFTECGFRLDGDRARQVLLAFRDGRFRRSSTVS